MICYDSYGRLVTILPSNQLNQLNRNSFPLNEIHQNVIEHQKKVAKPPQTAHFNHMQTQTQTTQLNVIPKNTLIYPSAVNPPQPTTCALTGQQQLNPMVMPVLNTNLPQFYTTQFTPSNQQLLNNNVTPNQNNSTHSHSK